MLIKKKKTTEITTVFTLTDKDLKESLKDHIDFIDFDTVKGFEVFVEVPSGGDWSSMQLNIDEETPLIIKVTQIIEE